MPPPGKPSSPPEWPPRPLAYVSREIFITATRVTTAAGLLEALDAGALDIDIEGAITGMPMLTLPPGVSLRGGTLTFSSRGVRLTASNVLEDVTIVSPAAEIAIGNDTRVADFGTLTLRRVRTEGQVLLIAENAVRAGHVTVEDLSVATADMRGRAERPHLFGVDAMQGAFTLWNRQPDPAAVLTAELRGLRAGTADTPVRGSGVFVGGHNDWNQPSNGGTVRVSTLTTGTIITEGGITPGAPDLISGGVFVVCGATVDTVITEAAVTTLGPNDMVLDNWGSVGTWTTTAPVISHGPSGIGFVNFGQLTQLDVRGSIETFGTGSRGFNLYDGTLDEATFSSITTHADGAIGIQVSRWLPRLTVNGDVITEGGQGLSLIRGQQVPLRATALSVTQDGHIGTLNIAGQLHTSGEDVITLDVHGTIDDTVITGGVLATGWRSDAVHTSGGADLTGIVLNAPHGQALVTIAT